MRDVYVSQVDTQDPEKTLWDMDYVKNPDEIKDKTLYPDGTVIFNVVRSGLRQRYSFTPDE